MNEPLETWIGRSETRSDVLSPQPARFMQATLDRNASLTDGSALPPLWHWLYFLDAKPASALGRDAHPKKGGFLPPVPLPRRMWAGGRFEFVQPLILGLSATKISTIIDVQEKTGRSGPLCFVTVRHELFQHGTCVLTEEHDIVYRDDPKAGTAPPREQIAPQSPQNTTQITPTEVMLFRYSALTFNGHRIHYDADYARQVEGYDGLVFHGPLTATLLADMASDASKATMTSFEFRAISPLAGMAPFTINSRDENGGCSLWARRNDGALAMTARAHYDRTSVFSGS